MKQMNYTSHVSTTSCLLVAGLLIGCSPSEDEHAGHDHNGQDQAAEPHAEEEDTHEHGDEGHSADSHEGEEHAGEDGHVELTEKQFLSAGIEVMSAGPGRVSEALTLPGAVTPNSDAVLHVTPRVSGQVRSVSKHLGESVSAGDLLLTLDSVELGDAASSYLRNRELVAASKATLEREQELFAGRLEALTSVLQGAIDIQQRIYDREEELQNKAVSTMRPLIEADKSLQLAKLEKDKEITELEAERDARLLALKLDRTTREIDLKAASNRLRTLGIGTDRLEGLDGDSSLLSGEYQITSPGAGIVVNRHASTGEYVDAGAKLYIIENLSSVWFVASAFEEQLQSVRSGQTARVTLDAFPGTTLNGEVSFLDFHVDPTSRSVGVRITLDNEQLSEWPEELPLRPGMFGRVELETTTRQAAIVLPEQALVHEDTGDYVFVQVEPFGFERRDVEVTHVAGGMVEVTSGLKPGESVAVSGTFLLKSAERQGELGGGHSH